MTALVRSPINARFDPRVSYFADTIGDALRDSISVRRFGAKGDGSTNDTAAFQAAIDHLLTDGTKGQKLWVPPGDYRVGTLTIDLAAVVGSSSGRLSIVGDGQASQITMRSVPNEHIFVITGGAGQSFSMSLSGLRFAVGAQENNVAAAVLNTGSATALDWQMDGCYINGIARGIMGRFVSGVLSNTVFDYMTDYAVYAPDKEFRKLEIVACHFYKVKDSAIFVDGSLNTSGGATTLANRDDAQAGGHITITGCGFDRTFDNTVTQDMVVLKSLDNVVISGCWFNGKTPGLSDAPRDFIQLDGCRNVAISGVTGYHANRGIHLSNCEGVSIKGLRLRKGNLAASAAVGAVSIVGCTDVDAEASISEAGGLGMLVSSCSDFNIGGRITKAQLTGIEFKDSQRGESAVVVVDANMADSVTASNTWGIALTGTTSGMRLADASSYVTNVAAGQKTNIHMAATVSTCRVVGGNASSVRTGGKAVDNLGANNRVRGLRGYETKASGTSTITTPSTSVTVAHGLPFTPSLAAIRLTLVNVDAAGVTRFRVQNVTASNFDIVVNAAPTASAEFAWFVDTEL